MMKHLLFLACLAASTTAAAAAEPSACAASPRSLEPRPGAVFRYGLSADPGIIAEQTIVGTTRGVTSWNEATEFDGKRHPSALTTQSWRGAIGVGITSARGDLDRSRKFTGSFDRLEGLKVGESVTFKTKESISYAKRKHEVDTEVKVTFLGCEAATVAGLEDLLIKYRVEDSSFGPPERNGDRPALRTSSNEYRISRNLGWPVKMIDPTGDMHLVSVR